MADSDKTQVVNTSSGQTQNPKVSNSATPATPPQEGKKDNSKIVGGAAIGAAAGAAAGLAAGVAYSEEIKHGVSDVVENMDHMEHENSAAPDAPVAEAAPAPQPVEDVHANTQIQPIAEPATSTVHAGHTVQAPIVEPINEPMPDPVTPTDVHSGMVIGMEDGSVEVIEFVDYEGDGLIDEVNDFVYDSDGILISEDHATVQELAVEMGGVDLGHAPEQLAYDSEMNVDVETITDSEVSMPEEMNQEVGTIDWETADDGGTSAVSAEALNEVDVVSSPDEAYQELLNESDFNQDDYMANDEDFSGNDFC
jgi:hypothetical protein